MGKLDDKVVVLTGASSGIGEATAQALAAEGATMVVGARRKERLDALAEEIKHTFVAVKCDVTDEKQAHELVQRAIEEFGRLDILVNNAGLMLLSNIEKGLSDEWRRMFEVNVMGLLYTTHAAIGQMKEQGSGHIVNVSSVAGRRVRPSTGVYSATKFAVNAISEALRLELLEDNVRVTVIEPGVVKTELQSHVTDEEAIGALDAIRDRLDALQAEDIANAITYAVTQPERVGVNEVLIRPTRQL